MTKLLGSMIVLALAAAFAARGADSGSNVIVIYNTRVPESRGVADHYAARRNVPTNQIFGFALDTDEKMSRADFRDKLQKPLAKALAAKKLWQLGSGAASGKNATPGKVVPHVKESKIRYAVLCYGVPTHIEEDVGHKEKVDEARPEMRRNEASVDSELALLPLIEQNPPLAGPLPNPLYAGTNAASLHPTNGILLVARLDGPNAAVARGLVDKALQAENDGLWGRAYFDVRNLSNPGYKMGDDWIRAAAQMCRHLGLDTVLDEKPATFQPEFPMSQIAIYCGWYDEHASGPFTQTNVEFMPGAFAYHLHSFSAAPLRNTTNRWVGPLLAKGATITMGCTAEPYLAGTPDLGVFCGRLIFTGFSFGEAAYASQSVLSWQTAVVGDPLYRPFAKPAAQLHEELERRHSPLAAWSYVRLINLNLEQGKRLDEISDYVERLALTRSSAVLAEKLANLYAAQGKHNSAAALYEKALKLDPTRQQRIRLRLSLGDKLTALNRPQDAYDNLRKLYSENPDYPAKFELVKQMLKLAIAIGNKDQITQCVQDMQKYGEEANKKAQEEAARNDKGP